MALFAGSAPGQAQLCLLCGGDGGGLVGQRGKFDLKIHTEGHTQIQRRCY